MKKMLYAFTLLLAILMGGCRVEKYNNDPNKPIAVDPQALLPDVLFYSFRGGRAMQSSILMRQAVGINDIQDWQTYNLSRGDFAEYGTLRNITKMEEACAGKPLNNGYRAIALILRAHNFYTLTMLYGDVPYSQALKGEELDVPQQERFYPAYDSQKEIFQGILTELEEANQLLKEGTLKIDGDIIYNGDVAKWRRLANSYKLKVLLMLSNREADAGLDPAAAFAAILNDPAEYPVFESEADQAQLVYLNSNGVMYPTYNDQDLRNKRFLGDVACDLLVSLQDPRLFKVALPAVKAVAEGKRADDFTAYKGLDASKSVADVSTDAATGEYSRINIDRYANDPVGEPALFLSYSELMLAKAEAAARGWISADAGHCYNEAIRASFGYYEIDDAQYEAYIARNAYNPVRGLEQIYQQRYILFFMQRDFEPWFHALRTGYPEIVCGDGQMVPELPFRLRYPQNEIDVNKTNMEKALKAQGFSEDTGDRKPWIY